MVKKILISAAIVFVLGIVGLFVVIANIKSGLPQLITVQDYKPLLVSQVFDRNNQKIGEFFRERRILLPYDQIPKNLVNAFLAAEDDQFFEHGGVNLIAIMRATFANIKAGRKVQGGSTITQQVAKTLLLSSEKTFTRKLKDIFLAIEMEKNLSKEEILYLYLNQIYFGHGAYGVEQAAQTYFQKPAAKLKLEEMAILAGLPQAPSRYSPVSNPKRSKERQVYVLRRMADVGYITKQESETAIKNPVHVHVRVNYEELAPFYLETVRQLLVAKIGENMVLDNGIRIYTSLDLNRQKAAQASVLAGLKELDKRQGYRGVIRNIEDATEIESFLAENKKKLTLDSTTERIILPDGTYAEIKPPVDPKKSANSILPSYIRIDQTVQAVVSKVDDKNGVVHIRLPEVNGLINFDTMKWARKPNSDIRWDADMIRRPSQALKAGDVILVKVIADSFKSPRLEKIKSDELPQFSRVVEAELDQEPLVEGALLSFDQQTSDILALVGGSNFAKSEFNRAIQAPRQTGSAFKALVYAAALDKGYTAATPIMDAPIVYEEQTEEGQGDSKVWKPDNHSKSFGGDIIFRNALVKSLNIPTVKIMEDIGVPWATDYARRLGIFSPINPDFTLALGSSSVTLYEMTKAFSEFGTLGKRMAPVIIHKVTDSAGKALLETITLDERFDKELSSLNTQFEERRKTYLEKVAAKASANNNSAEQTPADPDAKKVYSIDEAMFFANPDQLISPTTAYIMTTLLRGVVEDPGGTGGAARALGREVAGKTGSSNNYFDAWFIGYTPQIATGVWIGYDNEASLGRGEVGGRSALPVWLEYMKSAHKDLPQMTFQVPEGIVFANIDSVTGRLASAGSKKIIRQAFKEGTEPTAEESRAEEATDFLKQDFGE